MTHRQIKVDRMIEVEEKHGIMMNCYAFLDEEFLNLKVIGEIFGGELQYDLSITCIVYNQNDAINSFLSVRIDKEFFDGFEPFKLEFNREIKRETIGRVLVFPKKW